MNAIKDMKKDEMVAENYGPIFTRAEREERQKTLKDQYWFTCECIACTENWPTFEEMNDEASMRFRCESKNCSNIIVVPSQTLEFLITCQVCKKVTNIIKGLKVLQVRGKHLCHFKSISMMKFVKLTDKPMFGGPELSYPWVLD